MDSNHDLEAALAGLLKGGPAAKAALLLDFDGTLAEIAPHPDAVSVAAEAIDLLARLQARLGGAVALVSGRSIATLDRFLAPLRLDAAGLHGAEFRFGGLCIAPSPPPGLGAILRELQQVLEAVDDVKGLLVETKASGLALHWRQRPELAEAAFGLMQELAGRAGPLWRLQPGNHVAEIAPAGLDKGTAVRRIMLQPPFAGRVPIFCGDDASDEPAFVVAQALGGTGVKVGPGRTAADARAAGVSVLRRALEAAA